MLCHSLGAHVRPARARAEPVLRQVEVEVDAARGRQLVLVAGGRPLLGAVPRHHEARARPGDGRGRHGEVGQPVPAEAQLAQPLAVAGLLGHGVPDGEVVHGGREPADPSGGAAVGVVLAGPGAEPGGCRVLGGQQQVDADARPGHRPAGRGLHVDVEVQGAVQPAPPLLDGHTPGRVRRRQAVPGDEAVGARGHADETVLQPVKARLAPPLGRRRPVDAEPHRLGGVGQLVGPARRQRVVLGGRPPQGHLAALRRPALRATRGVPGGRTARHRARTRPRSGGPARTPPGRPRNGCRGDRPQRPLGGRDHVPGRGPRRGLGEGRGDGEPVLARRGAVEGGQRHGRRSAGATGGTARDPAAAARPSTSCTHANARSPVSVSWRRFSTVTPSSSNAILIGVTTAAYSASMGVGVPSASTMPSQTKLPSWKTSPKSPP